MKIEEIEKIALEKYPITMVSIFTKRDLVDKNKERRVIFIDAYLMAIEDNKYTEDDMLKSFYAVIVAESNNGMNFERFIKTIK